MKVYIGPYKGRLSPYKLFDWYISFKYKTNYWNVDDNQYTNFDKIVKNISHSLQDFANVTINKWWCDKRNERKIKVKIDYYDVWSADQTLAYIIHPVLVKLKEQKHGSPYVDPEDAPHIGKGEDDGYGADTLLHQRWEWVIDEMIWAFETVNKDWESEFYNKPEGEWSFENLGSVDIEGRKSVQDRLNNGFRLFGKYYQALWD